jgi:pimeloyl-ACP methyl ester carboxylesterase
VPDAELFVVKDANHGVPLEKNELVLDKMAAFLQ